MKLIKITLALLCLLLALPAYSQQQKEITRILDKYGKQKGSVLVQLSEDILSQGSNLTFYKSLILEKALDAKKEEVLNDISPLLSGWTSLAETKKQGIMESGTYYMDKKDSTETEFLLIKNTKDQLTIVYIQGNFLPKNLQKELKKLKDLFIYINDKRIKIDQ